MSDVHVLDGHSIPALMDDSNKTIILVLAWGGLESTWAGRGDGADEVSAGTGADTSAFGNCCCCFPGCFLASAGAGGLV